MSDFDRLLNLAQKSNGKIFIYDKSEGRHMLLLDLDEYENFLNFQEKIKNNIDSVIEDLDIKKDNSEEKELLEKINNDIAIWKSGQDEEKKVIEAEDLEEKLIKNEWHSISDVLNNKEKKEEIESDKKNKLDELIKLEDSTLENKKPIPFVNSDVSQVDLEELSDDEEEPIFFEEPI